MSEEEFMVKWGLILSVAGGGELAQAALFKDVRALIEAAVDAALEAERDSNYATDYGDCDCPDKVS